MRLPVASLLGLSLCHAATSLKQPQGKAVLPPLASDESTGKMGSQAGDFEERRRLEATWTEYAFDPSVSFRGNPGSVPSSSFNTQIRMSADGQTILHCSSPTARIYKLNTTDTEWYVYDDFSDEAPFSGGAGIYNVRCRLSSDGTTAILGGGYSNQGRVAVFREDSNGEFKSVKFAEHPASDGLLGAPNDFIFHGVALSADGDTIVFASEVDYDVRVYRYNSGTDEYVSDGTISSASNVGNDRVMQMSDDGNTVFLCGSAFKPRFWTYASSTWTLVDVVMPSEVSSDHVERCALSGNGNTLVVSRLGVVRVYDVDTSGTTTEQVFQKRGSDITGQSISSLGVSGNGLKAAIGNTGAACATVGSSCGSATVYQLNSGTWEVVGSPFTGIYGGGQIGREVELDAAGNTFGFIGNVFYTGSGPDYGYFEVHELDYGPYFDLDVVLDSVEIKLESTTDFAEAIQLEYNYTGPSSYEVVFEFDIYESDCNTEYAMDGIQTEALYFDSWDETVAGKVTANLGINLTLIETASEVWIKGSDQTSATLAFCGRWSIIIDNDLFQFHESNITANIGLTEDSGFNVNSVDVNLDRQDANTETQDVAVEFPVTVYFCDDSANALTADPQQFYQGEYIQVCLKVTTPDNVYLSSIDYFTYNATKVTGTTVELITGGNLQYEATAEVDCSQEPSTCRVKFVPRATLFINTDGNDNDLIVDGLAVVAFGTDSTRRRRMAFPGRSGATRRLSQPEAPEDENSNRLTPFQLIVPNLQPTAAEKEPTGTGNAVVITVVVGLVVLGMAGAVAYFLKRSHTRSPTAKEPSLGGMDPVTTSTTPKDRDGRLLDDPSSDLSKSNTSEGSDTNMYEVAEV